MCTYCVLIAWAIAWAIYSTAQDNDKSSIQDVHLLLRVDTIAWDICTIRDTCYCVSTVCGLAGVAIITERASSAPLAPALYYGLLVVYCSTEHLLLQFADSSGDKHNAGKPTGC